MRFDYQPSRISNPSKQSLRASGSIASRRQTFLQQASKKLGTSQANITFTEPNEPLEEEQEEQIITGDREARSNTISQERWERKHSYNKMKEVVKSTNPLANVGPGKKKKGKVRKVISKAVTKLDSFQKRSSLTIRRTSRSVIKGARKQVGLRNMSRSVDLRSSLL